MIDDTLASLQASATVRNSDVDPNCCELCSIAWEGFIETISANYPHVLVHFEAALSVCAVLALPKPWRPLTLIYEGPAGAAKSTINNVLLGATSEEVQQKFYRSDKFSTASFVSQAANVKKADLKKVDLLPRLKNKIFFTPELGPMFRGKPQEIEERMAILARVLDGRGLTLDSGTHGKRGYEEDCPFCWIGATTYLPDAAFQAMANVGNRIFFFDTRPPRPTIEDLARLAIRGGSGENERACAEACDCLLYHYFTAHCGNNCESPLVCSEIDGDAARFIASAAWSIARLRARGIPEYEYRLVESLSVLARARAAIQGQTQVRPHHVNIIRHIVASSCKVDLRSAMSIALQHESITSRELGDQLKCTRDTALKRMEELAKTGVFQMTNGQAPNRPSTLRLSDSATYLKWGLESSTISGECVRGAEEA